jgi:hypothetical protein
MQVVLAIPSLKTIGNWLVTALATGLSNLPPNHVLNTLIPTTYPGGRGSAPPVLATSPDNWWGIKTSIIHRLHANLDTILKDDKGKSVPLMSNALRPNLTTPFPLLNMPQTGRVPDKLMLALNLKNIIKEDSSTQLYTDRSKLQNGNTRAAAIVIDKGQLTWENKTHLGNHCEVYDAELFALMDGLRYLIRTWDDKSPIKTLYTMADNVATLEGAATGYTPSGHQWAYRAHA